MLLVSLSTVLTVFVLNVHYKEYRPLPPWMRTLFFSYFARIICYSNDTPRRAQVQHDYTQQNVNGFVHKSENGHVNCQHVSIALFGFRFYVIIVVGGSSAALRTKQAN